MPKLPTAEEVQQAVEYLHPADSDKVYHPKAAEHVATLRRVAEAWRNGVEMSWFRVDGELNAHEHAFDDPPWPNESRALLLPESPDD